MSVLLPVPTSVFPSDEERAAQRRAGSAAFFDGFRSLFGAVGLDTAAKNLRRYRSGLGGTQVYSDQEIEEHPLITEAEDTNRTRFTSRTLTALTGNKEHNSSLLNLKDGKEYHFKDHWQSPSKMKNWMNVIRHPDTYAAFGLFDVRSNGDFTARRRGSKLYVTGTVRHGFDEETEDEKRERQARGDHSEKEENIYNFNRGAIGSGAARDLEPLGAAKPFRMQYDRAQDLEAELEYLPDGQLLLRRSKWGPIH